MKIGKFKFYVHRYDKREFSFRNHYYVTGLRIGRLGITMSNYSKPFKIYEQQATIPRELV